MTQKSLDNQPFRLDVMTPYFAQFYEQSSRTTDGTDNPIPVPFSVGTRESSRSFDNDPWP